MYHAFFALKLNVFLRFGFLCINIYEPGGVMRVELKGNSPSMAAHDDKRGFCLHFSQCCRWHLFEVEVCTNMQWGMLVVGMPSLILRMLCKFAVLFQLDWFCGSRGGGGVYCCWVFWLAIKYSTSFDVSLYILCSIGLNPLFLQNV